MTEKQLTELDKAYLAAAEVKRARRATYRVFAKSKGAFNNSSRVLKEKK